MLDVVAIVPSQINYGSDTPSQISTHGGGAAGNVASWAQVSGAQTQIIARVGNDSAGIAILSVKYGYPTEAIGIAPDSNQQSKT